LLLFGHNAHTFDAPRLGNALYNDSEVKRQVSDMTIHFGDSLPGLRKQLKRKRNVTLSEVYHEVTNDTFDAHDAKENVIALKKIHYGNPLMQIIVEGSKSFKHYVDLNEHKRLVEECNCHNKIN